MPLEDRRNLRSDRPGDALTFLLHACRDRGRFEALVVADDAGLLVAHASSLAMDVEEIAAALPEPARRRRVAGLRTTRFDIDGQIVYVGAVGGDRDTREVDAAVRGVQRILAA